MSQTLVMVVEDEVPIQQLIAYNLKMAGYKVVAFESAEEADDYMVEERLPDVCVLDWMLPGMSGVDFLKKLRREERTSKLPIILLTAKDLDEDKELGFESGSDDYLTKPFSPVELKARINALLRRVSPQKTHEDVSLGDIVLKPEERTLYVGDKKAALGQTEFKLLHFFVTHPDRVFSRRQLLDSVWGDHVFIEERTVDVHIRRLRLELGRVGKRNVLETVRGMGYKFSKTNS